MSGICISRDIISNVFIQRSETFFLILVTLLTFLNVFYIYAMT